MSALPAILSGTQDIPTFNLWYEPWIGVTRPDGVIKEVGIAECLERAHELASLYDPSPLVVASVQRLLAAIAQSICDPREVSDVAAILAGGRFSPEGVAEFGKAYAHRFDLFSPDAPFMQTADVPLIPQKTGAGKTIGYLMPEAPSGTAVVHFRHAYDREHLLCPPCAGRGLVTQPSFATSGGAGIKPSINGVPPLYVLPIGVTLFETLALSLVTPMYQPEVASRVSDSPTWTRDTIVERSVEVTTVGYLESLSFPARRVRLYPHRLGTLCTHCGRVSDLFVSSMLFEMGHSRSREAPIWLDPFAAYTLRRDKPPLAVRPQAGRAIWREYGTLFAVGPVDEARKVRPRVLDQISDLEVLGAIPRSRRLAFRCIGMRTDMKAKIFEWTDASLEVPVGLLADDQYSLVVQRAVEEAEILARDLDLLFAHAFRPEAGGKRERYKALRERMVARYWAELAAPFREFVLNAASPPGLDKAEAQWVNTVLRIGREVFEEAVEEVGDRGADLRRRVQAVRDCSYRLGRRRKEWLYE